MKPPIQLGAYKALSVSVSINAHGCCPVADCALRDLPLLLAFRLYNFLKVIVVALGAALELL